MVSEEKHLKKKCPLQLTDVTTKEHINSKCRFAWATIVGAQIGDFGRDVTQVYAAQWIWQKV